MDWVDRIAQVRAVNWEAWELPSVFKWVTIYPPNNIHVVSTNMFQFNILRKKLFHKLDLPPSTWPIVTHRQKIFYNQNYGQDGFLALTETNEKKRHRTLAYIVIREGRIVIRDQILYRYRDIPGWKTCLVITDNQQFRVDSITWTPNSIQHLVQDGVHEYTFDKQLTLTKMTARGKPVNISSQRLCLLRRCFGWDLAKIIVAWTRVGPELDKILLVKQDYVLLSIVGRIHWSLRLVLKAYLHHALPAIWNRLSKLPGQLAKLLLKHRPSQDQVKTWLSLPRLRYRYIAQSLEPPKY